MPKQINILLLGETGVGKTTFVNMLNNYLKKKTWSDVLSGELMILAPTSFVHVDDNFEQTVVNLGTNENELVINGATTTQYPKSYLYHVSEKILRVIDTPGIGDTRGIDWNKRNVQAILKYISELEYLDAVCVFLKATDSRLSVIFDNCLKTILKDLVPNAYNNLLFVFTRARSTNYTAGDAYTLLKSAIDKIQGETGFSIPLNKHNIFCVDNEAFRYLTGHQHGIQFDDYSIREYSKSYEHSLQTINRMVDFIRTLTPIKMQNVATRNESKRVILRLSKPLLQLLTDYERAMVQMQQYEANLQSNMSNLDLLKQNLFKIEHRRLVTEQTISESRTGHKFGVVVGVGFPPFSLNANSNYNYTDDQHKHKTQNVSFVENRVFDRDVYSMIKDEKSARDAVEKKVLEMQSLCDEYREEMDIILEAMAAFFVYCNENDLINEDSFKTALLAEKDEAQLDEKPKIASEFQKLIDKYDVKKRRFAYVNPKDIQEIILKLFRLKHSGGTFKEIMDKKFEFLSVNVE